jgi:hypothetical protein
MTHIFKKTHDKEAYHLAKAQLKAAKKEQTGQRATKTQELIDRLDDLTA